MEKDKDLKRCHHRTTSRLTDLKDSNGNNIINVTIESELAETILLHPTNEIRQAIQLVSDKLIAVLTSTDLLKPHMPVINLLLSCSAIEDLALKQLSPGGAQLGKLNAGLTGMRLEQGILMQLSTPVDENNILSHLKIAQVISAVLYNIFVLDEGLKIQSVNADVSAILCGLQGVSDTTLAKGIYRERLSLTFPTYIEMDAIRIERGLDDGIQETCVKGIYPRDYLHTSPEVIGALAPHIRGIDKWVLKKDIANSQFLNEALSFDLPLVAGASGTASRMLTLIEMVQPKYGKLSKKVFMRAYKTYLLAYLVASGHHSMHEVGHIYNKSGDSYVPGDYFSLIPDEILSHKHIRTIIKKSQLD